MLNFGQGFRYVHIPINVTWYLLMAQLLNTFGLQFQSPLIVNNVPPRGIMMNEQRLRARLLAGECRQAVMTVEYVHAADGIKPMSNDFTKLGLENFL